jgi:hypothetical protein
LYSSGVLVNTVTSETFTIPASGVNVYVRLSYEMNSTWQHIDYTFTEAGTAAPPALTLPSAGTLLSGSTTFQWDTGLGSSEFLFAVGTTGVGSADLYNSPVLLKTVSSETVTIPSNGSNVYVRLYYELNAVLQHIDYVFTEAGSPAAPTLTSPTAGTALGGPTLFEWSAGTGSTGFILTVGTGGEGTSDLFASGILARTITSETVSVPSSGVRVYVRLSYEMDAVWKYIDYTFTEAGSLEPPVLISPASGATPGGSTTFQWTAGTGPSRFILCAGTTGVGSANLYDSGSVANTVLSATVTIPSDGVTVFVQLNYEINGVWQHASYTFTEAGTAAVPSLTSPNSGNQLLNGSIVSNSAIQLNGSTVFTWNTGVGAAGFILQVGTGAVGASNLFNSGVLATSVNTETVTVPSNGVVLYVRLSYLFNGTWLHTDYKFLETAP